MCKQQIIRKTKRARERYQDLCEEEENKKRQYCREQYKNLSVDEYKG